MKLHIITKYKSIRPPHASIDRDCGIFQQCCLVIKSRTVKDKISTQQGTNRKMNQVTLE